MTSQPFPCPSVEGTVGCCRECPLCKPGPTPHRLSVVIAGITDWSCGSCSGLNNTFVLEQDGPDSCFYTYTFDPTICNYDSITAFLDFGNKYVWVSLNTILVLNFIKTFVTGCNYSSLVVPPDSAPRTRSGCTLELLSTATVTSLY